MTHNSLVLVTGANGYIAARTVEAFLKAGHSVRGTVRSKSSVKPVVDALSEYASRLEIVEVPDITAEGAFDEAVKGMPSTTILLSWNLPCMSVANHRRRQCNCAPGRARLSDLHRPGTRPQGRHRGYSSRSRVRPQGALDQELCSHVFHRRHKLQEGRAV